MKFNLKILTETQATNDKEYIRLLKHLYLCYRQFKDKEYWYTNYICNYSYRRSFSIFEKIKKRREANDSYKSNEYIRQLEEGLLEYDSYKNKREWEEKYKDFFLFES